MEIPPYFDYKKLDSFASLREEKADEKKFLDLKNKLYGNLIKFSLEEYAERGERKKYRNRLNMLLNNKAVYLLRKNDFCNDLLKIAKDFELLNVKYRMDILDFLEYKTSPSINAFMARLRYHTIIRKINKIDERPMDLEILFENAVSIFLEKYNLDFYWTESIIHLLITGIWYLPRYTTVINIELFDEQNQKLFKPRISLLLSKDTTMEEIKLRWNETEDIKNDFFNINNKRNKVSKKYDMESLNEINDLTATEKKALKRLKKKSYKFETKIKIPQYINQMIFELKRPIKSIYFF